MAEDKEDEERAHLACAWLQPLRAREHAEPPHPPMLSIVALTSWLSRLGCIVLGSFYPAYASYRAVLSRDPDEHKQWLAFWVLAAGLALAELLGDACISWLSVLGRARARARAIHIARAPRATAPHPPSSLLLLRARPLFFTQRQASVL